MRQAVTSLLLMAGLAGPVAAQGSGAATGGTRVRACSLLTKELIALTTPYEKQALTTVLLVPPMEDPIAPSGSACSYGGVTLQIDPFPAQTLERQRRPEWVAVPDVGDVAYFHDNRGEYAELYLRAGARVVTVQMDVPMGRTAASIRGNAVALAKAVLAKLK